MNKNIKKKLKVWAKDLFPLNRSLTGTGNLETLKYIKKNINSKLQIKKVLSGTKCFDWKIPKEWNVKSAILKCEDGNIIADFSRNNLELMGYSTPVKRWISYKNLQSHLFTIKDKPNAIPYVTSYYKKNWGFCLKYNEYKKLDNKKKYFVEIKSELKNGHMHYGEFYLKGKSKKEILICSYICHPSMANNELSGLLACTLLAALLKEGKYSIRILLIPETIGAIYFINKNLNHLKKNLIAGFNLTCVGTEGPFTIISSINKNTYADVVSNRVGDQYKKFRTLSFLKRGSNERQFGCQNLNLPFVTFCRKKFDEYKEYHTSLDSLKILKYNEIMKSTDFISKIIKEINENEIYLKNTNCEPFLTKYNLVPTFGTNQNRAETENYLAYTNKNLDSKEIAKICGSKLKKLNIIIKKLLKNKIIREHI